MKCKLFFLLCLSTAIFEAQTISEILTENQKRTILVGDSAPDFILTVDDNSIRSFSLPQMKRITLLHFWNTEDASTKIDKGHLLRLLDHFENASYINAGGFEVIAIAVQNDIKSWRQSIERDSMNRMTHGMAIMGLEDEVCKLYNIKGVPSDILVDEKGNVAAINPRMVDIENILDSYKNYQPLKRNIAARMAYSFNKNETIGSVTLNLNNYYGDSITYTAANPKGEFYFHDIKLNQDFILRLNNQTGFTSHGKPPAIYTLDGELVMEGRADENGFGFNIPAHVANRLIIRDSASLGKHAVEEIDVIKSLTFSDNGSKLTAKDEKELNILVFDMQKNPLLRMDFMTHTDSRVDELKAMEITSNQVNAIKNYFQKKGLDLCRITGIAKGNTEMRKLCLGNSDCGEEDHKLNRRVEFLVYKELTE